MISPLFKPLQLGAISLSHRVVMAPLTRMRAGAPDNVPTELSVEYYRQRASTGGLIISEASQVSQTGQGYPTTPGIHSAAQVAAWKKVVEQVHARGGKIFMQLWHVGRLSHTSLQPGGKLPVAPSALAPASPMGLLLIARLHGRPIGCGALKFHQRRPAELKRMWIAPAARGLGVGRRLLGELERTAGEAGVVVLRLETNRALSEA